MSLSQDKPAIIRVLVAEDSLTIRKMLVELLDNAPGFEVIGEASDGREAIELCAALRPDVITMDMMMPVMTGLSATEYIMAYTPTPILIVSASVNRSEALRTLDALAAGAVEILDKPLSTDLDEDWIPKFLQAIREVSRVRPIRHPRARLRGDDQLRVPTSVPVPPPATAAAADRYQLVGIGASTGGPQALTALLPELPIGFHLPILLVIHIDVRFDITFLEWLATTSHIPVEHAWDKMPLPEPGKLRVIVAPAGRHLIADGTRLRLIDTAERHSCRPSIDVLFESMAQSFGPTAIGCLLTGMGRDGAAGLLALRQAGGMTLAQDEQSSIIHGMPGEAIRLGAARRILPLNEFAIELGALAQRRLPDAQEA